MKFIISLITGILVGYLILFHVDPWIVQQILDMFPVETNVSTLVIVKIISWSVLLFFTAGLTAFLATVVGVFIYAALDTLKS